MPDVSWMDNPPTREHFVNWMPDEFKYYLISHYDSIDFHYMTKDGNEIPGYPDKKINAQEETINSTEEEINISKEIVNNSEEANNSSEAIINGPNIVTTQPQNNKY
jgi:hypothetical protein